VGQWPHGNWAKCFGKTPMIKKTTTTMDPSKFAHNQIMHQTLQMMHLEKEGL
jgi:hypothetical protein